MSYGQCEKARSLPDNFIDGVYRRLPRFEADVLKDPQVLTYADVNTPHVLALRQAALSKCFFCPPPAYCCCGLLGHKALWEQLSPPKELLSVVDWATS